MESTTPNKDLVGTAEVAEALGFSTSYVKRLARLGQLPEVTRISGRRAWSLAHVIKFRDQMEKRRAAKAVA